MKRIFGMMPSNEIKISKRYEDQIGLKITIDAGPHGWTILYADGSSEYADKNATSEDNFNEALTIAQKHLGDLKEISDLLIKES